MEDLAARAQNSPATCNREKVEPSKRPLRTYSRHPAPNRDLEPPMKKRKVEKACPTLSPGAEEVQPPCPPKSAPAQRESILLYFKTLHPSSSASRPTHSADVVGSESTPPSSPPPVERSRSPRRLTTRPYYAGGDLARATSANGGVTPTHGPFWSEGGVLETLTKKDKSIDHDAAYGTADSNPDDCSTVGEGKSEIGGRFVWKKGHRGELVPREYVREKSRLGKRPKKNMEQATLNLNLNRNHGLTICKDCGILYNKLNEKDRKEHSRRHAAYRRALRKGRGETS